MAVIATVTAQTDQARQNAARVTVSSSRGSPYVLTVPGTLPLAGAVASVLDTACGYAAFSVMPPDAAVLTASYTINLLAPAAGERFTITGEVVRAGRTLVVCRGEAFADGDKRPFAVMQATMTALFGRPGING